MASFQTQIMGLTDLTISSSGTNPTEAQLTQFLTDGAKEIINSLPGHLLPLCASSQTFTSGSADTLTTGKILNVFRSDGDINQPCRKIPAKQKGRVSAPEDMAYATITDPIYYIDNNGLDVLPSGGSCSYSEVQYPAVAYSADAVTAFPDEAEHLVVLYGAVKSIQNVLGGKSSNSDITTAVDAANTELDKIVTDINIPVAPDINTISYADVTAPSKAGIGGSVPTFTKPIVGLDFAQVNTHLDTNEDTELASTKIQQIQAQLSEYNANIQNEQAEFNKENAKYQANVQAEMAKHNSDLQVAIANGNKNMEKLVADNNSTIQKYSNELQSYQAQVSKLVQSAQGYINEVQSRLQVDTAQYSWYEKQQAKLQADYDKGLQALS